MVIDQVVWLAENLVWDEGFVVHNAMDCVHEFYLISTTSVLLVVHWPIYLVILVACEFNVILTVYRVVSDLNVFFAILQPIFIKLSQCYSKTAICLLIWDCIIFIKIEITVKWYYNACILGHVILDKCLSLLSWSVI